MSIVNYRDFQELEIVKYHHLIHITDIPGELEIYLMKNGLLGNFSGICSTRGRN